MLRCPFFSFSWLPTLVIETVDCSLLCFKKIKLRTREVVWLRHQHTAMDSKAALRCVCLVYMTPCFHVMEPLSFCLWCLTASGKITLSLKEYLSVQVSALTRGQHNAENMSTTRPVNAQLSLTPSASPLSQWSCSLEWCSQSSGWRLCLNSFQCGVSQRSRIKPSLRVLHQSSRWEENLGELDPWIIGLSPNSHSLRMIGASLMSDSKWGSSNLVGAIVWRLGSVANILPKSPGYPKPGQGEAGWPCHEPEQALVKHQIPVSSITRSKPAVSTYPHPYSKMLMTAVKGTKTERSFFYF